MILDTNAISAWAENDPSVLAALQPDRPWFLPSIALGEFRFGILGSRLRVALEHWLDTVETICTVLTPDSITARLYGELRRKIEARHRIVPYHDIWIAALAQQHQLPVVSRDVHFDLFPGLRRIGW